MWIEEKGNLKRQENNTFKSIAKDLERAYLSSGGSKNKSPALKKSSKLDNFNNKHGNSRKTITPRSTTKKHNLQLSVMVLTNELLNGNANGEYKMKSFQMVMNRIFLKISTLNSLLNKSPQEITEGK